MMSPQYLEEITSPTATSQQQQRQGDDTIHSTTSGHVEVEVEYMTEEEEIVAKEEAILAWLWTFPQVSNVVKNEEKWSLITELDHLKDIDVIRAILNAASEICNTPLTPNQQNELHQNIPGHWNTIAQWTQCDPSINGTTTTRNSTTTGSTTTIPLLSILSALLCCAIDEQCDLRNTYIGRIMGLNKGVQRTLMQLIQDFNTVKYHNTPKTNTNAHSGTDNSNTRREPHPDESYLDELNIDEDNESLLDEIEYEDELNSHGTGSLSMGGGLSISVSGDGHGHGHGLSFHNNNVHNNINGSAGRDKENVNLNLFQEDPFPVPAEFGKQVQVQVRAPLSPFHSPMASGNNGNTNMFNTHNNVQNNASNTNTNTITSDNNNNNTTSTTIHEIKKLAPPPSYSSSSRNISARKVIKLEREASALHEQNTHLQQQLELLQQSEHAMRVRCEEQEAIHRAARLKLESDALMRETDLREELMGQVRDLQRDLKECESNRKEAREAREQLASLQDEVDILQHSKIKLSQTENQLQKLKQKMEQMGDIGKALEDEEKAHSSAVSKCLELENELAMLGPLKRQLEDYKIRATNAEVKLVDCEDEIKKLKESSANISGLNHELQRGSLRQMEEADHLRRTLEQNESNQSQEEGEEGGGGCKVGKGISEMNPELKEELLRLRTENVRLKAFAAKRQDDSVQKLEEQHDDATRLADRFKEQYLSTKSSLENTQKELTASLQREQKLEFNIAEEETTRKGLEKTLQEERIAAQKAKLDATRALHAAKKEMGEQAKLERSQLVQEWEVKLEKQRVESQKMYRDLEEKSKHSIDALNEGIESLRKQSVESLRKMEQEFMAKTELLKENHQEEINQVITKNEEVRVKLIEHGKQLIQKKKEESNEKIQTLQRKVEVLNSERDQLHVALEKFEQKVETKVQAYRQRLSLAEARADETARECDEMQTNIKKLEREKTALQAENERFRRQIGGRLGSDKGQYEDLQRNYNDLLEENRALREKASSHVQAPDSVNAFDLSSRPYSGGGAAVSASSLSQLRAEYEEKLQEIKDEKRELIMKNSALITGEKRAKQRAWDLEVDLKKLENETTSLQLQLERKGRQQQQTMQSPAIGNNGKRVASKLTPGSLLKSKATKMWKGSKFSRKSKNNDNPESEESSPRSLEPSFEFSSPEFKKSVNMLKKSEVEGFKDKLVQRINSAKKKSPLQSMSLMDLAARNEEDGGEIQITFGERMDNL